MREAGIAFKWKDCRPTGGQLALDAGVPIDQVSQSMRHASTKNTERYYCRARADLRSLGSMKRTIRSSDPSQITEPKRIELKSENICLGEKMSGLSRIRTGDLLRVRQTS
jgi:hypothetical protein